MRPQGRVGSTPASPQPTPKFVASLAAQYYQLPGNSAGGNLHITLDDGNIETQHVLFCLEEARATGDALGMVLADMLLRMTRRQRAKAVGR